MATEAVTAALDQLKARLAGLDRVKAGCDKIAADLTRAMHKADQDLAALLGATPEPLPQPTRRGRRTGTVNGNGSGSSVGEQIGPSVSLDATQH